VFVLVSGLLIAGCAQADPLAGIVLSEEVETLCVDREVKANPDSDRATLESLFRKTIVGMMGQRDTGVTQEEARATAIQNDPDATAEDLACFDALLDIAYSE
jgi:hypothetical protein